MSAAHAPQPHPRAVYVGIDPGQQGAIAWLGERQHVEPMPLIGKDIDAGRIAAMLRGTPPAGVVIEKAQAMPKQGVTSMFRYGTGYGAILGVLAALGVPHVTITPQAWKRLVLAGTARDKASAIQYATRAHPWADLMPGRKRTPHDGMADAICIAEYARHHWKQT